jgi:serine/threonine protein kinase
MNFTPPENDKIIAAFPSLQALTFRTSGGFKAVYKATTDTGAEAFKLLCLPAINPLAADKDIQAITRKEHLGRAMREVELLRNISIPEIVKLGSIAAEIKTIDGVEYLGYSEEWLDGNNLWEILRAPGRVAPSERECVSLLNALVAAISHLWILETVHRDIKPLNVMRLNDTSRQFVLLDLGIAYDVSEPGLTYNTAIIPATYRYIAPEMVESKFRERLDFRSDLYTAGLTVYEYATGLHPVARDGEDMLRTVTRALREMPMPLKNRRADFSDDFCTIIDQLLRKRPMLRPGNLTQLLKRLEGIQ